MKYFVEPKANLLTGFRVGWRASMRLRIIGLMSTLALGMLVGPLPAAAQQPENLYRIGYLGFDFGSRSTSSPVRCRFDSEERECAPTSSRHIVFRQRLRELGYVAGQNYVIEYRKGNRKQLPDLVAELVKLKVDVIVAGGRTTRPLKSLTHIPIVFVTSACPVAAGLTRSLARPSRNMTGVTWMSFEINGKRLELVKEVFPDISRVAILSNPMHAGEPKSRLRH